MKGEGGIDVTMSNIDSSPDITPRLANGRHEKGALFHGATPRLAWTCSAPPPGLRLKDAEVDEDFSRTTTANSPSGPDSDITPRLTDDGGQKTGVICGATPRLALTLSSRSCARHADDHQAQSLSQSPPARLFKAEATGLSTTQLESDTRGGFPCKASLGMLQSCLRVHCASPACPYPGPRVPHLP